MKNILIIANFLRLPWENGNSRFIELAEMLTNRGNKVELITSSFSHGKKSQRTINPKEIEKIKYKITLINEPGYNNNISIKRLYSHYKLSKNLRKYLKKLSEKPDIIYCAVPSLSLAKEATRYAKQNKIKFIIDIQDLWPEAFKMKIKIPIINDILFYPFMRQANYIYKKADEIIAVSETYKNRALHVNKKSKKSIAVFLGTDLNKFDKYKSTITQINNDEFIKIAYIGTLGYSYNIKEIIDSISYLDEELKHKLKFIIMGDGPLKNEFENYAKDKKINVEFTGRIDYSEMIPKLCTCDIAVNPINKGSAGSIINKVCDYAAAGLPVINTQECKEYIDLVEKYKIGYNCENGNIEDIANKIKELSINKEYRKLLGSNNRKLAEERFDRSNTYIKICNLVENNDS